MSITAPASVAFVKPATAFVLLAAFSSAALAQTTYTSEANEPNDDLASAESVLLSPGDTEMYLEGRIMGISGNDLTNWDYSDYGTLSSGSTVSISFPGIGTPDSFVYVFVDNDLGFGTPDLLMMDQYSGSTDDDSSPLGNGLAPGLLVQLDYNGDLDLDFTGSGDSDFFGNHTEWGDFEVFVTLTQPIPLADYSDYRTLMSGFVESFQFTGIGSPYEDVYVFLDNSGDGSFPDLIMQNPDTGDFDDDSSPLGDGLASAFNTQLDANGDLNIDVSGFGDDSFIGDHSYDGGFDIFVALSSSGEGNGSSADVDIFEVGNLTAGATYEVSINSYNYYESFSDFYPVLGAFESNGDLAGVVFDGGYTMLVEADSNGQFTVGVTGDYDLFFNGDHNTNGEYEVQIFQADASRLCTSDIASPAGALDSNDHGLFMNWYWQYTEPAISMAPPLNQRDFFDIAAFGNALAGCPVSGQ